MILNEYFSNFSEEKLSFQYVKNDEKKKKSKTMEMVIFPLLRRVE
jgi:hypothetical protein